MKNQKGFSLIELLIVVVIIGIIAAIAIPNLLAARRAANEGSAISSIRTIHGATITYIATTGGGDAPVNLVEMSDNQLIDTVLSGAIDAANSKSGYFYTYTASAVGVRPAIFAILAVPSVATGVSQTGSRDFMTTTDGVIWGSPTGAGMSVAAGVGTTTGGAPLNN